MTSGVGDEEKGRTGRVAPDSFVSVVPGVECVPVRSGDGNDPESKGHTCSRHDWVSQNLWEGPGYQTSSPTTETKKGLGVPGEDGSYDGRGWDGLRGVALEGTGDLPRSPLPSIQLRSR